MDKDGLLGLPLTFFLKLVLIIAILVLGLAVFDTAFASLVGGGEEEAHERNADNMASKITDLLEDDSDFATDTDTFQIGEDYTLIGFDSDTTEIYSVAAGDKEIPRPQECEGKSCVCLYEQKIESAEDVGDSLVSCWQFEGEVVLSGWTGSSEFSEENFGMVPSRGEKRNIDNSLEIPSDVDVSEEYLVLYGDQLLRTNTKEFYLEKYTEEDVDYVLVAPNVENMKERSKYFGVCNDDSHEDCIGNRFSDVETKETESGTETYSCEKYSDTDRCTKTSIERCDPNQKITEICACGDKAYRSGYCVKKEGEEPFYSPINCRIGPDYRLTWSLNACDDYGEREACVLDYCRVDDGPCEYSRDSTTNLNSPSQRFSCKSAT